MVGFTGVDGDMEEKENVRFRYMTLEDISGVLKVEHASFSMPWSEAAFYNELTGNRFATYILAEMDGKIIGYCGVWVIIDEAHITNIALMPEYRGKKIGEALLRTAMQYARMRGARKMTLEVRVSNEVAQALYRKLGFEPGGIRKNYYTDNYEDALVMWVRL
ncbi:MAG TPA: ribosomal protein S18-alanine N-acetyltransferase [Bacillales bacterium]|nr:ribosomal protein S18-alanine N-acetyltransferase [Bacillales bacterium]